MTSANNPQHPRPLPSGGASLIELMVGLVIGLLVSLAAATSAERFTAMQRQGVSVGGANTNALSALAAIKDDVASGGIGFFSSGGIRCSSLNLSVGNNVLSNNAGFAPVMATRIGSNDRLDVVYAQNVIAGAWTELSEPSAGDTATLKTMLPVTVAQGTAILMGRTDASLGSPCVVRSTTAASADRRQLTFDITGNHNRTAFAVSPNFKEFDPVIMLGNLSWNRYELDGTDLVMEQRATNTRAVLLNNVIAFRVQYGVSATAATTDTTINAWNGPEAAGWNTITTAQLPRVKAVRIGLVIRSSQREKNCSVSTNPVRLFNNSVSISLPTDGCFRYRTVEVVAPIRNHALGTGFIDWAATGQTS